MLWNCIVIAFRNLYKHKFYSLINILGLVLGLVCCLLVLIYVHDEFQYEAFHDKSDRIHRVVKQISKKNSAPVYSTLTSGALGGALASDFPEIEQMVRLYYREDGGPWIKYGTQAFRQEFCVADSNVLDVFTLPLIKGDPKTVLQEPFSVLVTETVARKFFGSEDPIGKMVTVEDQKVGGEYKITGILKDLPIYTHLKIEFLTATIAPKGFTGWIWHRWEHAATTSLKINTYVVLPEKYNAHLLKHKMPEFMLRQLGEEVTSFTDFFFQPIKRIRLYSHADYRLFGGGNITYIYIFVSVAFFTLLIACINYMNLATARSMHRKKEMGMRKVVGANRQHLIVQFLGESILQSFVALLLSFLIIPFVLPFLNELADKNLSVDGVYALPILLGAVALSVLVGILAGSYPAFFLSSPNPIAVLKDGQKGQHTSYLRQGLVCVQFIISIGLIVCTLIVRDQLTYLQDRNLGFDRNWVVAMNPFRQNYDLIPKYQTVKEAFLNHPGVLKASVSLSVVGIWGGTATVHDLDSDHSEGLRMHRFTIDEDFLDLFAMPLILGDNFKKANPKIDDVEFILNETAVKQLGLQEPLGRQLRIQFGNAKRTGTVIGVVKDFHSESLFARIGPAFLYKWQPHFRWINLKISPDNVPETLQHIEATWKKFLPDKPFSFRFLDDWLNDFYQSEFRIRDILDVFFVLALFIALIGLLGLVAFSAEQKTKEIGIRKTLGATLAQIVLLLSKEFAILIMLANVVAWPCVYFMMEIWLSQFAYYSDIRFTNFVLGGGITFVLAMLTTVIFALKAALANPVDALRYE